MKIKCIAIDDEPWALEQMERYISQVPFLDLIASFTNAIESIEFINTNNVELIFLDIQMEGLSGIKLLEVLNKQPGIIFTTAYDEYAIQGYDLDVIDYLLKPIAFERFLKAANKAYDHLKKSTDSRSDFIIKQQDDEEYFFVKSDNKIIKIKFSDIVFIEGMKDYLRIHTREKRVMTLMSFKKMSQILPESKFFRIHKSFIISMDYIESIEANTVIVNKQPIPIGRKFKQEFLQIITAKGII
ncbi:LytR/AlgR family response regulator transcription factor [Bacteroidota bacterium]